MGGMTTDPQIPGNPASYTGRYYALPLRGRVTPYEGGAFAAAPRAAPEGDATVAVTAVKKPGFSFGAFLDLINPLQHIPIVSSLYRRMTGDEINPMSRIAGDTLFFGVFGLAGALVNTVIEKATGQDVGDHVMAAMLGKKDTAPSPPAPDDRDDGANNALATIPQQAPERGRVTVHPIGITPVAPLDAATLDALARTIGGTEPLAHLAQPLKTDSKDILDSKDTKDTLDTKDTKDTKASSPANPAAAASYNDALIRMQQGLEIYQAKKPEQPRSPAN